MERLRGASLAKILNVLRLIHEEKERRKSEFPRIVVNFVAQNDNYRELPELARQLAPLEIYFLGVNPLHHFDDSSRARTRSTTRRTGSGQVPRAEFEAVVAEAKAIVEAAGNHVRELRQPGLRVARGRAERRGRGAAQPASPAEPAARAAELPTAARSGRGRPGGPSAPAPRACAAEPRRTPTPGCRRCTATTPGRRSTCRRPARREGVLLHVGPRGPRRVTGAPTSARPGTGRSSSPSASTSATAACTPPARSACSTGPTIHAAAMNPIRAGARPRPPAAPPAPAAGRGPPPPSRRPSEQSRRIAARASSEALARVRRATAPAGPALMPTAPSPHPEASAARKDAGDRPATKGRSASMSVFCRK